MFFMLFIFPLLNHLILLSISFLQLSALEEEAVPFVWLHVSCQLNLLPFNFCIFNSCHAPLSFQTSVLLLLLSSLWDMLYFQLSIPCAESRLCLPQLPAPPASSFVVLQRANPLWCTRGEGGSFTQVLHTGLLSAFHHCYLSCCWHMDGSISFLC